ncbi:hypothetical protein A8B75_12390 [Sphingomonadales bacterium EhC05]|jgi:hypothetical protein|nr:hypothetical protein A8B75_12390 [Sphingomonadales bacterium EhC05]|tara:strand:+ start:327 stop:1703 length:1377 start_codon:yes stop_codon:yes gene_type:complete
MTTLNNTTSLSTAGVEFDKLSSGVDRILERWSNGNKPTKLTLLNDLAAAIQPGANWGALKAAAKESPVTNSKSHAHLIPIVPKSGVELPARISSVSYSEKGLKISELADDVQPLFSLNHEGDPIVGLLLSLTEGNGFCEVSNYSRLILVRDGETYTKSLHALDLAPEIARLIYGSIHNLQSIELYPVFAQSDCGQLHILLGPSQCIATLPEAYGRVAPPSIPSQGLRILFDEGEAPLAADVEMSLRLASATLPHLGLKQFPTEAVQFKLSEPLMQVWKPVAFEFSQNLDERPMYREPGSQDWVHHDDFLYDNGIQPSTTLGEPLDLALALINIDDPNVYLKASLTAGLKNPRGSKNLKPGWRGGLHSKWEVLRLRSGNRAEILSLNEATRKRLETGLNGWAMHEGYNVTDDLSLVKAEALISRHSRRASHHMKQVEAIMDGADPTDKTIMKSLELSPV